MFCFGSNLSTAKTFSIYFFLFLRISFFEYVILFFSLLLSNKQNKVHAQN
jgi:hypothetical protein